MRRQHGVASPAPDRGMCAGQFLDVKDSVRLERQSRVLPVYLLTAAEVGDIVRVPSGGYAELVLDTGGRRLELLGGSVSRVDVSSVDTISGGAPMVKRRLAGVSRIPRRGRGIAGQAFRAGVLVDEATPPTPCGAARALPVTIAWSGLDAALKGAGFVEIQVREASDGGSRVKERLPGSAREFRVPPDRVIPGKSYVWEVLRPGPDGAPV